jgi:hypothetical protein
MKPIDPEVQAQVDAQLLEQGAFSPLDWLLDSGRVIYSDYESWRRGEIDSLDDVLMGSPASIQAQLESAVRYARSIGLVEQTQELHAWQSADTRAGATSKPLRVSSNPQLQRLIGSRFAPAQSAPQMDLFFDNPVVALINGVVRALSARNIVDAQRQLDRLYAQSPNHADLAAFDRLLEALGHLDRTVDDAQQETDYLLEITPLAKRLLGSQARDLLAPLWRQVADALEGKAFSPQQPNLHRSFALSQAQDWAGVGIAVHRETNWYVHPALCLRLAQSAFYRRDRAGAMQAWCHFCWRSPALAAEVLDKRTHPDAAVSALWSEFLDSEDESSSGALQSELTAADFPAWLLLREPALVQQLPEDLPTGNTAGEAHYRCVHRCIQARRAGRRDEELALRKTLQRDHALLFSYLKRTLSKVPESL